MLTHQDPAILCVTEQCERMFTAPCLFFFASEEPAAGSHLLSNCLPEPSLSLLPSNPLSLSKASIQ